MSALRSVVYVSTATGGVTAESLESLITEARKFNLASGVTGVLLYADGNFMQCFEGADDAVHGTYTRILASRKHRNIIELMNAPVDSRAFEGWHMGLAQPSRSNLLALTTGDWQQASQRTDANPSSMGLDLLKGFWKSAGR
ncbi:MAG: BLUF domain-containing protein [Methylibium sp.]|uniref:BLUF domain-containing protein n=1 Tax=Methylibium sp. TaxID=2067992 RepID=UPI0017AA8A4D|nr:BLUF domain-containing protein [Methylibium sp.]MBA2723579.1 BLUF domain-containing protein [Methylibium sp.]MBA3588328.1 BLUF domain-containing protein [Methylibium sp.]